MIYGKKTVTCFVLLCITLTNLIGYRCFTNLRFFDLLGMLRYVSKSHPKPFHAILPNLAYTMHTNLRFVTLLALHVCKYYP